MFVLRVAAATSSSLIRALTHPLSSSPVFRLTFYELYAATKLVLSFKHIVRIENLVGFQSLTKLCLDNNQIEEIVNLGHIKTLRWLDLSFNKIRKIQGLSELVNLEDLSLYANKISVLTVSKRSRICSVCRLEITG